MRSAQAATINEIVRARQTLREPFACLFFLPPASFSFPGFAIKKKKKKEKQVYPTRGESSMSSVADGAQRAE